MSACSKGKRSLLEVELFLCLRRVRTSEPATTLPFTDIWTKKQSPLFRLKFSVIRGKSARMFVSLFILSK